MATLVNINVPSVKPSAAPTTNAISVLGDDFVAQFGRNYLLRFTNASVTPGSVVLDDIASQTPLEATQFDPDVTVILGAGQTRVITVEAHRFRDPVTGKVSWTYSADMVNAGSLVEIHGPM